MDDRTDERSVDEQDGGTDGRTDATRTGRERVRRTDERDSRRYVDSTDTRARLKDATQWVGLRETITIKIIL